MAYTSKQTARETQAAEDAAAKQTAPAFTDQRVSAGVQLQQQQMMHTAQAKFATAQRAGVEEEEPLQGKFTPVQRAEEEELLQGKFETVQRAEEEELLQGKFATAQRAGVEEEEPLQGKFATAQLAAEEELLQGKFSTDISSQAIAQREEKPNNTGLPNQLKSGIESLSGMSLDNVKVHYNSSKPAQLNAHAYAQGSDIHVAPGQEQHLPHEAWHVVQQAQGRVKPTTQMKGTSVNDDVSLETEADVMGAKAQSIQTKAIQLREKTITEGTAQLATGVVQRQQTDVCLKSASGTYDLNGTPGTFNFTQSSKGSDVLFTTKSHPSGYIDHSDKVIKYLKKQKVIPNDATNIVVTAHDTYGIKL
jgi:Domain of unknown function (DUF4157)